MLDYPDHLTVLFDGNPVGHAHVTQRHPRKFFGEFIPGPHFETHRTAFDEAMQLDSQLYDQTGRVDYVVWDRLIETITAMTKRVALPEISVPIEEFSIGEGYALEVCFFVPPPSD